MKIVKCIPRLMEPINLLRAPAFEPVRLQKGPAWSPMGLLLASLTVGLLFSSGLRAELVPMVSQTTFRGHRD